MPNIEDLKNSKPANFTPSLKQLNPNEEPVTLAPHTSAGLVQGTSNVTTRVYNNSNKKTPANRKTTGGMTIGKKPMEKPDREDRVPADFSNIPRLSKQQQEEEMRGIDQHKSIEDDIFGPGGPFDKYKEEKMKEYQADMEKLDRAIEAKQLEDEEKAEEARTNGESVRQNNTDKDSDTIINQTQSYHDISLKRKEKSVMVNEDKNAKVDYYNDYEDDDEVEEDENDIFVEEDEYEDDSTPETTVKNENDYSDATEDIEDEVVAEPATVAPEKSNNKEQPKRSITDKVEKVTRSYMAIEDEKDDDEIEVTDPDDNSMNSLKALITKKIKPVAKKLNLDGFAIARKGTTSNNILQTESTAVATWVLPTTGIVIKMREISGANMELLRSHLDRRPVPNTRGALKILYDHIVTPKPSSFEEWLKSVAFADYDNLYMTAYIASFADSNYLPIDCNNPQCKAKAYLTDNIEIMDLVKFVDKDSEDKFWNLYYSDIVNAKGLYVTKITPISDRFAVAFKEPSLYDVLIESGYFNEEFNNTYANTIAFLPYIDAVYYIDIANTTLVPVEYKNYDNNISRTARSKVMRYSKVFNTLTPDQNAIITAHINAINERINWFNYQIPETTCPECGHVNPAIDSQTAISLLFLRNRLAVLATI